MVQDLEQNTNIDESVMSSDVKRDECGEEESGGHNNDCQPSIKKNYLFSLLNKLTAVLVPIFITPFLARVLEADGNGVISYVTSIASYFILVANLGLETYGQKLIAIHHNDKKFLKKLFWEIFILRFILTAVCLLIYCVCFIRSFNNENSILYAIFAINIFAVIFDFTWFFQGLENFKILAVTGVISKAIYMVLTFCLVKTKDDLPYAALFTVGNAVIPFLLCFPFAFKYIGGTMEGKLQPFLHFKECMVYFVPTVAVQIYTVLDKTMIGLITHSSFENGYYEQADKLIKLPLTLITTLYIIMRSRISYYYSIGENDKIKDLINKSANIAFGLSLPIMFGMIAITPKLVPVYLGAGYDKCIMLMYVLSPLVPIISISNLLGTHYYTPFDKQKVSNIFLIMGAVANIALNLGLIFAFASIGAAIASVVAELLIMILYVVYARSFVNTKKFFCISVKYLIASLVMFAPVILMDIYLPTGIWWLILEVSVGIIIYAIMLLILRVRFVLDFLSAIKNKFSKH